MLLNSLRMGRVGKALGVNDERFVPSTAYSSGISGAKVLKLKFHSTFKSVREILAYCFLLDKFSWCVIQRELLLYKGLQTPCHQACRPLKQRAQDLYQEQLLSNRYCNESLICMH